MRWQTRETVSEEKETREEGVSGRIFRAFFAHGCSPHARFPSDETILEHCAKYRADLRTNEIADTILEIYCIAPIEWQEFWDIT